MKAIVTHYSEFNKSEQKGGLLELKKAPEIGDFVCIDESDNYDLFWELASHVKETDDGCVLNQWRIENYDEIDIEGQAGYVIWVINDNEIESETTRFYTFCQENGRFFTK